MSRCRPKEKSHTRQAGPDIMDFIDLNMHLINPQIEVVQKPQTTGHKHHAKTFLLNELETINYNLPINHKSNVIKRVLFNDTHQEKRLLKKPDINNLILMGEHLFCA